MKLLIPLFLILAVCPTLLYAQQDWCPCIEEEVQYEEFTSFVKQKQVLLVSNPQPEKDNASDASLPQKDRLTLSYSKEKANPVLAPEDRLNVSPRLISQEEIRRKRKSLYKGRIKRNKKGKKYRGQCPSLF